jgi:hypothetical protein
MFSTPVMRSAALSSESEPLHRHFRGKTILTRPPAFSNHERTPMFATPVLDRTIFNIALKTPLAYR